MQPHTRSQAWKWWICGLLLCASAINYMDRQALASAAVRISAQFHLTQQDYGNLEWSFGWAFALGSMAFGVLVDRVSVRWVYPLVLLLWSGVGFATGFVESYSGLLVCRALLGLFEAGHWPCAVKTTQLMLSPADRSMGNGVLQSGTSIGAILVPQVMRLLLTDDPSSWRGAFQAIGALGLLWVLAWFALVRRSDLKLPPAGVEGADSLGAFWKSVWSRRMVIILIIIALINTSWQTLRAWLPKFMQEGRGYTEAETLNFTSLFYVASDVGCLGAGALTLWLVRRGFTVHRSRSTVFFGCALLSAFSTGVFFLGKGWMLGGCLLIVGAGVLGLFPIYHALTQDISQRHQGKVTGLGSVAAWLFTPPLQAVFGRYIDKTHSFDLGLTIAGWLPMVAAILLLCFWEKKNDPSAQG